MTPPIRKPRPRPRPGPPPHPRPALPVLEEPGLVLGPDGIEDWWGSGHVAAVDEDEVE
jgi:hypothetical protein